MAIEPDARQRWQERRIGDVPLSSGRGIAALVLLGISILITLSNPVVATLMFFFGDPLETQEITLELLVANFLFNTILLVALPVAALAIARPGRPNAVVRRLGLSVDKRTPLWVVVGAAAAIASIFALGIVIFGLTQLGMQEPEESPLIEDIDELLTWPLVFLIPFFAAVTEEIFFRGVLQPRIGLIASSVFFGIVHIGYGTWLQIVAPIFLGLLFGILFQRTRSLWAAIAAHYTFDFVQLVALMLTQ